MTFCSRPACRTSVAAAAMFIAALVAMTAPVARTKPQRAQAAETPRLNCSPVRFDDSGQLLRPVGYRKWIYVGAPVTPNDMNNGKAAFPEFHSVYVEPQSFEYFEKTGEFQDGTVLIKELVSVGSKQASSGRGYFMGEFIGLEVAIKDETRFKDEPGHWAYFSFGHEYPLAERAEAQPVANCSACHGSLAADDYVFTQYYPVLRAAKNPERSK